MERSHMIVGMQVVAALIFALLTPQAGYAMDFHCPSGDVVCLINAIKTANGDDRPTSNEVLEENTITLEAGTYTLTAADNTDWNGPTGLPVIVNGPFGFPNRGTRPPLKIMGAGAETTIIERAASAPPFRLVTVGGTLTLQGVTLRGGSTDEWGGGINNGGKLTLTQSILTNNMARHCGGLWNLGGQVILINSTVASNTAEGYGGGLCTQSRGLWGFGSLTITNSTLVGNRAGIGGGAIWGDASILNSTIAHNMAGEIGGGIDGSAFIRNSTIARNVAGAGGGIYDLFSNPVTLQNTILALNAAESGPDCFGSATSWGNNLLGQVGDHTFCALTLLASDRTGDPGLAPFADNGTPGGGHFPVLTASPAIDGGNDSVCPPTDQLGHSRVSACDIGAIEFPSGLFTLSLNGGSPVPGDPGSPNRHSLIVGDTLILTATLLPGPTPSSVDGYIALQVPEGTLFFLQEDGSFTPEVRPIVSNWTVVSYSGEVFRYTFSGDEPAGSYRWLGAFTEPGTLTIIREITQAPFNVR